jgi:hypothetical protein
MMNNNIISIFWKILWLFMRVIEDAPTWLAIQQTWRISTSHKRLTGVIDPRRAGLVLLLARGPSTIHACATGMFQDGDAFNDFSLFFSSCSCESATQFPEMLNVNKKDDPTSERILHTRDSYPISFGPNSAINDIHPLPPIRKKIKNNSVPFANIEK